MNTESAEHMSLLNSSKKESKRCKLWHVVVIVTISVILTGLLSNIDRIIKSLQSDDADDNIPKYDTIIIGGGPAGMLQFHFLQKYKGSDYKLLLLEKLNRVGGRTFTTHLGNTQTNSKIFIDHGAIQCRYNNKFFMKVLKYLNMCNEIIPFKQHNMTTFNPIYSYRSKTVRLKDNLYQNNSFWINNYNLNEVDKQMVQNQTDIGYIYRYLLDEIIEENEANLNYSYDIILNNYTYHGIPLYNYSPWTILRSNNFSFEFIAMMASTTMNSWSQQQFGVELHELIQEGSIQIDTINNYSNYGYWTLLKGMDSISQKLYNLSYRQNEKNILLNNKLISIQKNNDFYMVKSKDFGNNNSINSFYAKNVILSIDVSNLKNLIPYIPVLDNQNVKNLLNSVVVHTSLRISLIYDDSFWRDYDLMSLSRSRTTTEISGVQIDTAYTDKNLTSISLYPLNQQSEFWEMLQLIGSPYPINENIEIISPDQNTLIIPSTYLVKYAVNILNELWSEHINFTIPMPLASFYAPWAKNLTFGDSVATWKIGYNANDVLNDIFKPNKDENIFIAINDFSVNQGWSDGAYWAANQNLIRNFNIPDLFQNQTQCVPY